MIVGNAKLGGTNLQYQPGTSTSVSLNNITEGIMQGSSAIVLGSSGSLVLTSPVTVSGQTGSLVVSQSGSTGGYICNSQGYIADVLDSSITNNLATAKIISYNNTNIQIQVTLTSPYTKISGLWIVT